MKLSPVHACKGGLAKRSGNGNHAHEGISIPKGTLASFWCAFAGDCVFVAGMDRGLGIAAITTTAGDPDDRASGLKQPSEFRKPGYADVHCPVCGERSDNDL